MKQMKIGFCKGHYFFSKLIMWCTKSVVSHTYIVLNLRGSEFIYEASIFGVRLISRELFLKDHDIVWETSFPEVPSEKVIEIRSWLFNQLGKRYGLLTLLGFAIFLLGKYLGTNWRNPWKDGTHTFICSELVAQALRMDEAEDLTPNELMDILKERFPE